MLTLAEKSKRDAFSLLQTTTAILHFNGTKFHDSLKSYKYLKKSSQAPRTFLLRFFSA